MEPPIQPPPIQPPPIQPQYLPRAEHEYRARITGPLSCYTTEGLRVLQEYTPDDELPDFLLVHDPHATTGWAAQNGDDSIPYYRVKEPQCGLDDTAPEYIPTDESTRQRTAHIYLHPKNLLGQGGHAWVYRAPLSRHGDAEPAIVAAKLGGGECSALRMLANEAAMYSRFPPGFMQDSELPDSSPVVPKFYGYYLPVPAKPDLHRAMLIHSRCCADEKKECDIWSPSPILLAEECGRALGVAEFASMTLEHQRQCENMLNRFHEAGFLHQSVYGRNILIQPGPLHVPPEERSSDTPCFRLIDFGRTVAIDLAQSPDTQRCEGEQRFLQEVWESRGDQELHTPKADRARERLKALREHHLMECLEMDRFLLDEGLVKP